MGCSAAYNYFAGYFSVLFSTIRQVAGDDGIALGVITVLSVGLVLGLQRTNEILGPWITNTFIGDLCRRAEQWFQANQQTRFRGFRFQTAVIAVLFGFVCYLWTKFAVSVPTHFLYSLGLLGVLAIGFSAAGIKVSPNIHFRGFFRYFYLPAASGIGLGAISWLRRCFWSDNLKAPSPD